MSGFGRDPWRIEEAIARLGPMTLPADLASAQADSAASRGPGPYEEIDKLRISNPTAQAAMDRLAAEDEAHSCTCVKRTGQAVDDQGVCCNERCINRCVCLVAPEWRPTYPCVPASLLNCECTDETCPVGDKLCQNRRIQRGHHRRVKTQWYGRKGWGIAIEEPADAGDFVLEFLGEIVDDQECERRLWQNKLSGQSQGHVYLLEIARDVVLDCTNRGNQARFLNHSCDPNCEIQLWRVGNTMRLGLFARRAIPAGEELTFDYQFQNFSREAWECLCGAESCQGQLGSGSEERGEASDSASAQNQKERRRRLPAPAKEAESSFARLWHAPYPYEDTFSHISLRSWRVAHLHASAGQGRRSLRVPPEVWCTRWTCRAWRKAFGRREPGCPGGCAAAAGDGPAVRGTASSQPQEQVSAVGAPALARTPDLSLLAAARIRQVKQWVKAHCPENAAARSMVERLDMDTETAADELDTNEAVCGRCDGVGFLICCDKCPQSFHLTCAGLFSAPKGDWTCPDCMRSSRSSRSLRREQSMIYRALAKEEPTHKRRRGGWGGR